MPFLVAVKNFGSAALASEAAALLRASGIEAQIDEKQTPTLVRVLQKQVDEARRLLKVPVPSIDIAPANYPGKSLDPCVVAEGSGDLRVVAIADGAGSWGMGAKAAEWTRAELRARWRHSLPVTALELVEGVESI